MSFVLLTKQPCSVFVELVQINEDSTRRFKAKSISEKMQSIFSKTARYSDHVLSCSQTSSMKTA